MVVMIVPRSGWLVVVTMMIMMIDRDGGDGDVHY